MIIYDTNLFREQIRDGKNVITGDFEVIDFNIYEWLKGKDEPTGKIEFVKLDSFVRQKGARYQLRTSLSKEERILNNPKTPKCYRYKVARKVALEIYGELLSFCISIIFILITVVAISKHKTSIIGDEIVVKDDADYEITLINRALADETHYLNQARIRKMARDMFMFDKKSMDLWVKSVFNAAIDTFNKKCEKVHFDPIKSKHINLNDLTSNCQIKIKPGELKSLINQLISPKYNNKESKEFFYKLVASIVVDNKSFEFNHIVDVYYQYAADCLEATFVSVDKKRIV